MGVQAVWHLSNGLRFISRVAVLHVRKRFWSWQDTRIRHTDVRIKWESSMTEEVDAIDGVEAFALGTSRVDHRSWHLPIRIIEHG